MGHEHWRYQSYASSREPSVSQKCAKCQIAYQLKASIQKFRQLLVMRFLAFPRLLLASTTPGSSTSQGEGTSCCQVTTPTSAAFFFTKLLASTTTGSSTSQGEG